MVSLFGTNASVFCGRPMPQEYAPPLQEISSREFAATDRSASPTRRTTFTAKAPRRGWRRTSVGRANAPGKHAKDGHGGNRGNGNV